MTTPAAKTPEMREFWVCPHCKHENFFGDEHLAGGSAAHLNTTVPLVCTCPACHQDTAGADLKVVGEKWSH